MLVAPPRPRAAHGHGSVFAADTCIVTIAPGLALPVTVVAAAVVHPLSLTPPSWLSSW